jgi:adenosylhomocysteine nucleosidase
MTSGGKPLDSAPRILVCFAVREEATVFNRRLDSSPNVNVLITGMGRTNAESAFRRRLQTFKPEVVLTCGFAGALDPALKIGDALFSGADAVIHSALLKLGAKPARFHCAPRIAVTAAEKNILRTATRAAAVEMESEVIHELCRDSNVPTCVTLRVISDGAGEDLPLDFNRLMTPDQRLSYFKLAAALVKAPGRIPQLMQLQKHSALAAQRLADLLHPLVGELMHGIGRTRR